MLYENNVCVSRNKDSTTYCNLIDLLNTSKFYLILDYKYKMWYFNRAAKID